MGGNAMGKNIIRFVAILMKLFGGHFTVILSGLKGVICTTIPLDLYVTPLEPF
jgi:hypothetical protein